MTSTTTNLGASTPLPEGGKSLRIPGGLKAAAYLKRWPGMNQATLYAILEQAGCKVLVFEDHPQFFGNWLVHFSRGVRRFEVVSDNREGWLSLWGRESAAKGMCLREVPSHTFNQAKELEVLAGWLLELAP